MKQYNGKVFIVGAGPGDTDLITLKALNCIERANVILYDELVNATLLKRASINTELIYVGKKEGCHSVSQDEMGNLLVEYAKAGKTVCRLKGGDPFVFGRGGEEAELLFKNNIPFEIVPGITSAISAPAYAGIPITQRGFASGFCVFTGHEDPTKDSSDLNWQAIAKLNSTLVFLMGMKNLPLIIDNLIQNGMDENTPIAIIHRGTTPLQKTVTGTLKNIVSIVKKESIKTPSIIVVGKVVSLRESLSWFENKPLLGKEILVTRTRKQASSLVQSLHSLGAMTHEFPLIELEPNEQSHQELETSIKELSNYDWIVFTSTNGVEVFLDRISSLGFDGRIFKGVNICAIGSATRDKLAEYFIKADLVPNDYVSESIIESLKNKVKGKKVLLPRADIARDVLPDGLTKCGADVKVISTYHIKIASGSSDELKKLLGEVDLVTFASSSTVDNFVEILGNDFDEFKDQVKAASIGPITTSAIKKHSLNLALEAREYTIPGLVDSIIEYFK